MKEYMSAFFVMASATKPSFVKKKRSDEARKLLYRLLKYQEKGLRFLRDSDVPFDNNQAEWDLRIVKVKQHISGTFRGEEDVYVFCAQRHLDDPKNRRNAHGGASPAAASRLSLLPICFRLDKGDLERKASSLGITVFILLIGAA
jgi:hypothetical protein